MKTIEITHIHETAEPWSPQGKKYTVYAWKCDIEVDGNPVYEIKVSTLSHTIAKKFAVGWKGEAEQAEYKGVTEWKLKTPPQQDGGYNKGGGGSQRSSGGSYTKEEYEALYFHALRIACQSVTKAQEYTGDLTPGEKMDAICRLAPTYIISARQEGIKA